MPSSVTPPKGRFLNRELGILEFNRRVLAQAENPATPLLERLRFLCITSSNLDEFFEVRVSGIREQLRFAPSQRGADGLTPVEIDAGIADVAHQLVARQYAVLNDEILPALGCEGIRFYPRATWNPAQTEWIKTFFYRELLPVLSPIGLDPAHPFPNVLNKSLNFAVDLSGKDAFGRSSGRAVVQVPRVLPRVVRIPGELSETPHAFVFLSSILHAHMHVLFPGMDVLGCYQFRVTRNSELFVDEEESKNLREQLAGELPHRQFGRAVRLEVADSCPEDMSTFLLAQFGLRAHDLYRVHGPVNLVRLMGVPDLIDRPDLKFPAFVPALPVALRKRPDVFEAVRCGDVLLHHPYQSFQPVMDFLGQAAVDPDVLAIKITVYRAGSESELMETLIAAAHNGKEVTVVVELRARFDEETNINWAERLEKAGAHVVYGVVGYKTHAKLALVMRRENGGIRRYAHLGTGNYHLRTVRLYTDFGLLTTNHRLCEDVNEVFMQLTGLGRVRAHHHLLQAPFTFHAGMLERIRGETQRALRGERARIMAKMNALLEPKIIDALYDASQAGVRVDLLIRGVCALRPGLPGLSENIRVFSLVGRFLEHHRVYYFLSGGAEEVFLASADWMDRNFFRRIETCFPILDAKLKRRVIHEGLKTPLKDKALAWEMLADGTYRHRPRRGDVLNSQEFLLQVLAG